MQIEEEKMVECLATPKMFYSKFSAENALIMAKPQPHSSSEINIRKEIHLEITTFLTKTQLEKNRFYVGMQYPWMSISIFVVHQLLHWGDSDTAIQNNPASRVNWNPGYSCDSFNVPVYLRKDTKLAEKVKKFMKLLHTSVHCTWDSKRSHCPDDNNAARTDCELNRIYRYTLLHDESGW